MDGIVAERVSRSFGRVQAVRDTSFHAEQGRVTGLVGPNGSGKTTLLLMLASLLAPDAGLIRIAGIDPVADPSGVRRVLGWMPDALGAWPSLTARETLVTTARLYDLAPSVAAERAAMLLDLVGLTALADAPARVLSRGQKQKLGLARALVHAPSVLLLDEPASGLDPDARVQLRILLRQLAREGRTILLSSHVLSELEEVVDDVVFLLDGRVVAAPSTSDRTWRVRTRGEPDPARAAALLGLTPDAVGSDRGELLVSFADEDAAARGLQSLVAGGVQISEFAPAQSLLESSFLALRVDREVQEPRGERGISGQRTDGENA